MAERIKRMLKRKKQSRRGSDESDEDNNDASNSGRHRGGRGQREDLVADDVDEEMEDFYGGHREQMRQMDQMFRDPFGGLRGGMMALPDASSRTDRRRQQQQAQNMQVAERNLFMDPFAHFGSMFSNMRSMMTDMHRAFDQVSANPNAHVYQQSSFMSYTNTGNGAPKVYQAGSSSRQGPGGVKETRKTVRDSEAGVERMAVGHHINDRAHVIERSRNTKTGEAHENQEFINLEEEEARPFDQEYQEKWRSNMTMRGIDQRRREERSRHAPVGDAHHRARHLGLPEPERRRKSSSRRE